MAPEHGSMRAWCITVIVKMLGTAFIGDPNSML